MASTHTYDPALPIAVVGISCRFPDSATSPEKFWDFLLNARCALKEIPKDRFNIDAFWHPSSKRQGTMNVRGGYFLEQNIAAFDAPFFAFTASEAHSTDPQQRLLLETAYEAIENAGIPMTRIAGTQTSCYIGSFMKDYQPLASIDGDDLPAYGSTGHSTALLANRISHFFDLRGPSVTLDTGCSGSTVAFHMACESIRTGEATTALAGGVGAILAPDPMFSMVQFNFLSPDSKCHSFDHRANGYARGEGFSLIVLKSLADAIRDNDTIRAVIRASSVSQDGKTPGITLPSSDAQADLIKSTYAKARLSMEQTAYFEAHGTGTTAGDAAELNAIGRTLGQNRRAGETIHVGSVKTNIGHLEGCAGLAGILKSILAVEHGCIPQNLWFEKPNPMNDLEAYNITIPAQLTPWPISGTRRTSINCFGFGGTLAHIILDDARSFLEENGLHAKHATRDFSSISTPSDDSFELIDLDSADEPPRLYAWSSTEQSGVDRLAAISRDYVGRSVFENGLDTRKLEQNFSYTLCSRRSMFAWRSFHVATSMKDIHKSLSSCLPVPARIKENPRIAYILNGQGSQWYGMGQQLMIYESFRDSVTAADTYLRSIGATWSALQFFQSSAVDLRLDEAEMSQPICTIVQVAIINLLRSWNLAPAAVVGHSSGEIAAAYAAEKISDEHAWALAYYRGLACSSMRNSQIRGGMLAVGMSATQADELIGTCKTPDVHIACINSDSNVTLSGDLDQIHTIAAACDKAAIFARKLKVPCAYHSPHMRPAVAIYAQSIKGLVFPFSSSSSQIRMFSSIQGKPAENDALEGALGHEYWTKNLVSPVDFDSAIRNLMAYVPATTRCKKTTWKPDILLEIGPHSTLQSSLKQIIDAIGQPMPTYTTALIRHKDARHTMLLTAGTLWANGCHINLAAATTYPHESPQLLTDLPPYPWNHSKLYWHEARASSAYRFRKHPRLDLVGALAPESTNIDMRWRNIIRMKEMPWIADHQVQGTMLYPAAGMICMVVEAAQQLIDDLSVNSLGIELRNIKIGKAMILSPSAQGLETSLRLRPVAQDSGIGSTSTGLLTFHITSRLDDQQWQEHCSGLVDIKGGKVSTNTLSWKRLQQNYSGAEIDYRSLSTAGIYAKFEAAGLRYGRAFQTVSELSTSTDGLIQATVQLSDTRSSLPEGYEHPHLIHPTTLDGMFQAIVLSASDAMVPTSIRRVFIGRADLPTGAGAEFKGFAMAQAHGLRETRGSVVMTTSNCDTPKVILEDISYTKIGGSVTSSGQGTGIIDAKAKMCSKYVWEEDALLINWHQFPQQIGTMDARAGLWKIYSIAAHKDPEGSVLEIGSRATPLVHDLLLQSKQSSEHAPPFFRYTVTKSSDDSTVMRKSLGDWASFLEFHPLHTFKENVEQGHEQNKYSFIITHLTGIDFADLRGIVRAVRCSMRPTAFAVFLAEGSDYDFSHDLGPALNESNLCLLHSMRSSDSQLLIAQLAVPPTFDTITKHLKPVLIVERRPQDQKGFEKRMNSDLAHALMTQQIPFQNVDLSIAANSSRGRFCISNLELSCAESLNWSKRDFNDFHKLALQSSGILWVTRGAQDCAIREKSWAPATENSHPSALSPLLGIFRSMRSENASLALHTLDLSLSETENDNQTQHAISSIIEVFRNVFLAKTESEEFEFAQRGDRVLIPRIKLMDEVNNQLQVACGRKVETTTQDFNDLQKTFSLSIRTAGELESLYFHEEPSEGDISGGDEFEVRIMHVALAESDASTFNGQTSLTRVGQFAIGKVIDHSKSPKRPRDPQFSVFDNVLVCDLNGGLVRNKIRTSAGHITKLPPALSNDDARQLLCLIPLLLGPLIAFSGRNRHTRCMLYGYRKDLGILIARLLAVSGHSVFIVVTQYDLESTTSHLENTKNGWLRVISAGDEQFIDKVITATEGHGVDLLMLPQESDPTGIETTVLAQNAEICHIYDTPATQHKLVSLPDSDKDLIYRRRNLFEMHRRSPDGIRSAITDCLNRLKLQPEDVVKQYSCGQTFPMSKAGNVLRTISQSAARSINTAVLHSDNDTKIAVMQPPLTVSLPANATYLIVGGLGGIGASVLRYLISRGARHIVIISRSGSADPTAASLLAEIKSQGAHLDIFACDVTSSELLQRCLDHISADDGFPPIRGVINAAMVLKDCLFENMDYATYMAASEPKIKGSWHLHELLPKNLDFFIMLSSVAGIAGTRGQANYNAGNAYQYALARMRRRQGFKATAIGLTVTVGVGWLAGEGKEAIVEGLKSEGVGTITEEELHALLGPSLMGAPDAPTEILVGIQTGGFLSQSDIHTPLWAHDARFSYIRRLDMYPTFSTSSNPAAPSLPTSLPAVASLSIAIQLVQEALVKKLAKSLLMLEEDIDTSKPVSAYGVDSLVAVEVRNWIAREVRSQVSVFELLADRGIGKLAEVLVRRSKFVPADLLGDGNEEIVDLEGQ